MVVSNSVLDLVQDDSSASRAAAVDTFEDEPARATYCFWLLNAEYCYHYHE